MALRLVHEGLAEAAMFTPEGEVVQPAEVLYKRPILENRNVVSLKSYDEACLAIDPDVVQQHLEAGDSA